MARARGEPPLDAAVDLVNQARYLQDGIGRCAGCYGPADVLKRASAAAAADPVDQDPERHALALVRAANDVRDQAAAQAGRRAAAADAHAEAAGADAARAREDAAHNLDQLRAELAQVRADAAREREEQCGELEEVRNDLRGRAERAERELDAARAELARIRPETGDSEHAEGVKAATHRPAPGADQLAGGTPVPRQDC